jgi:hypothetical protein
MGTSQGKDFEDWLRFGYFVATVCYKMLQILLLPPRVFWTPKVVCKLCVAELIVLMGVSGKSQHLAGGIDEGAG